MRKWHRWLSIVFGVILLWIAGTGVASQVVPLWQRGGLESEAAEKARAARELAAATPPGFVCPETLTCRPKPKSTLLRTLHHLHSGDSFGPVGIVLTLLAGVAMVFFSLSGLWLYVQMFRHRAERKLKPGWFWN